VQDECFVGRNPSSEAAVAQIVEKFIAFTEPEGSILSVSHRHPDAAFPFEYPSCSLKKYFARH
jgi:hypothetical protein